MSERRIVIYGNAGAGKTTMARGLRSENNLPLLLLDSIAWSEVAVRRPLKDSIDDLERLVSKHSEWLLEGCYGDLIEAALPHCTGRFLTVSRGRSASSTDRPVSEQSTAPPVSGSDFPRTILPGSLSRGSVQVAATTTAAFRLRMVL